MNSPIKLWRRQKEMRNGLGKIGIILSWTKIHVSGDNFNKNTPYSVVLVQFDNGQKAFGQLVDSDDHQIIKNQRVIGILRKIRDGGKEDIITYGLKFKLL